MARDKKTRDMSESVKKNLQSSEDLVKNAYSSLGINRKDKGPSGGDSLSAGMAASASSAAVESAKARTESAEEIAKMLAAETKRRSPAPRPAASSRQRSAPPRQASPPPRQASPPSQAPRPRRTQSLPPPPVQSRSPQPARAPQPAPAPQPQQPQTQRKAPGRSGLGWLAFAAIWVISAIVGLIGGDSDNSVPDISINVPEITIDSGDLTSSTLATQSGFTNIREVSPGACIESLPLGDVIDDVLVVGCDESHQYEVFAITTLDDAPDTYPSFDEVVDIAFDSCSTYFFDYVGETYASSEWYVDVITPTEVGWNKADDRVVNCLLYIWDEDLGDAIYTEGAARDSGDAAS